MALLINPSEKSKNTSEKVVKILGHGGILSIEEEVSHFKNCWVAIRSVSIPCRMLSLTNA